MRLIATAINATHEAAKQSQKKISKGPVMVIRFKIQFVAIIGQKIKNKSTLIFRREKANKLVKKNANRTGRAGNQTECHRTSQPELRYKTSKKCNPLISKMNDNKLKIAKLNNNLLIGRL